MQPMTVTTWNTDEVAADEAFSQASVIVDSFVADDMVGCVFFFWKPKYYVLWVQNKLREMLWICALYLQLF